MPGQAGHEPGILTGSDSKDFLYLCGMRLLFVFPAALLLFAALGFAPLAATEGPQDEAALLRRAEKLHNKIISIDTHTDTALELIKPDVDLSKVQASFPRLREGRVDCCFYPIFVDQGPLDEASEAKVFAETVAKMEAIRAYIGARPKEAAVALGADDIVRNKKRHRLSLVMGLENGYPIGRDLSRLKAFYDLGARIVTLSHNYDNDICDASRYPENTWGGLSPFGKELVREMNRLGVIVDCSHASTATLYDCLALSAAPVICSHSCVYTIKDHPRNLTDDEIRAIAAKGGVIQVTTGRWALSWLPHAEVNIGTFCDHVEYIRNLVGVEYVGVGTDFDGGGGMNELEDASKMKMITVELMRRGWTDRELELFWGGNFLRVIRAVEAVRDGAPRALVGVIRERSCSVGEMISEAFREYGNDLDTASLSRHTGLVRRVGRPCRFVAVRYRTVGPGDAPIEASGLIAFPEWGPFKGVVEVSPVCKEKSAAGTKRMYAVEAAAPATMGYVALIPDTFGYGITEDHPICYLESEMVARQGYDLRRAAAEYFADLGRELPRRSVLFGYSLGAPGALSLAGLYVGHPEYGVRPRALFLGGGPYDPRDALESSLQRGEMGYMLFPGICRSLNAYHRGGFDSTQLFRRELLSHWEEVSSGEVNPSLLAERFGADLRGYLHPDFFREGYNAEIRRLFSTLSTLAVDVADIRLSGRLLVWMRHSADDNVVSVSCSDLLYRKLHSWFPSLIYCRDRRGTHYEEAGRTFLDLLLYLAR